MIPTLENTFLIPGATSGLFGFAAGYTLKKVLKFVIVGIGLLSLVIAYLEIQKWINVNWPIVENQTTAIAEHIASKGYAMSHHIGTELGVGAAGFSVGLLIACERLEMKFLSKILPQGLVSKRKLFDDISGHKEIKWAFNKALRAEKPVHILLIGSPGGGKTRFLKAIENRFPSQSYFALASGASGAGMVSALFDKQPKYLLIDEIEHMKRSDIAVLQSLMQDGDLIETKKVNTRSMELHCFVFAACNDDKKLSNAILSRFQVIHLKDYTRDEFIKVTIEQLDVNPEFAAFIGEQVWHRKNYNVRDCVRISSMCQTEEDVARYLCLVKDDNN